MVAGELKILKIDIVLIINNLLQEAEISLDVISKALNLESKQLNTTKGNDFIVISDLTQGVELVIENNRLILNQFNIKSIDDVKLATILVNVIKGFNNFKSLTKTAYGINFAYTKKTTNSISDMDMIDLKKFNTAFKDLAIENIGFELLLKDLKNEKKKYNLKLEPFTDTNNQFIFRQNSHFDEVFSFEKSDTLGKLIIDEFEFGKKIFSQFVK